MAYRPRVGAAASIEHPDVSTDPWRGTGKILVVDDEAMVREVLQSMLEGLGMEVLTATDGDEAVELFKTQVNEVILVLLDLTMQRLNGEETLRQLRAIRSDVRVVLMSGYDEQETATRHASEGLAGFLHKPIRMAELQNRIRVALRESRGEAS